MRRPYARPSASRIGRLRPAGVCAGGQAHQARHARAAPHALLLCASAGAARATGPYRVSLASTPPTHHRAPAASAMLLRVLPAAPAPAPSPGKPATASQRIIHSPYPVGGGGWRWWIAAVAVGISPGERRCILSLCALVCGGPGFPVSRAPLAGADLSVGIRFQRAETSPLPLCLCTTTQRGLQCRNPPPR